LGDGKAAHHGHIERQGAWPLNIISARIAERPQRIRAESSPVEPLIEGWIAHVKIGDQIRPVGVDAVNELSLPVPVLNQKPLRLLTIAEVSQLLKSRRVQGSAKRGVSATKDPLKIW